MQLPFTTEAFFSVFEAYNKAVFPAQIVLVASALWVVFFLLRPRPYAGWVICILLALWWAWMGIVYHLGFFAAINPAARVFGIAGILQALLFSGYAASGRRPTFAYQPNLFGKAGMVFLVFALVLYPILGYAAGHRYPAFPTFGLPCPVTIFTLGVLLMSRQRVPLILLIIPVLWSVIGFSAAFYMGVWADTGLILAGGLAWVLIRMKNRRMRSGVQ